MSCILRKEAESMANKINVRLILELHSSGMSQNQIAHTRHFSKLSVSKVIQIAAEQNLTYEQIRDMNDDELYFLFFPDKYQMEHVYQLPDYDYVHQELRRVGVTLKLLWQEYKDDCRKNGALAVGYTKYCDDYNKFISSKDLTNHLQHKPGYRCEVDWSGPKMKLINRTTGDIIDIYLFVACLPYSQYTYVEPTFDMKMDTWLRCHIRFFEFIGGVPVCTVCDNLKTGVVKHPKEGEIILTDAYEALGSHYVTAIMPTGVRKPKQKSSVESSVGKLATAVIAKLRNQTYHEFSDLQKDIRRALIDFNNQPFQKRKYSRSEVFSEELKSLRQLPTIPYEISTWEYDRKVYPNSHVCLKKNFYSVNHKYVGKHVDIRYTDNVVEVYVQHQRISSHPKFPDYIENRYHTCKEDMPDAFNQPEMNDERMRSWASMIGSSTLEVVNRIFRSVTLKEQGYNSALSVLNLSKSYPNERLEVACKVALQNTTTPRYKIIKAILSNNQDILYSQKESLQNTQQQTDGAYIRGAAYYGGERHDQ